jgi:hypothetical protein
MGVVEVQAGRPGCDGCGVMKVQMSVLDAHAYSMTQRIQS